MSAAVTTLPLVELDVEASVLEAASKRVRLAIRQSHFAAIGGVGCFYLHRAQRSTSLIKSALSGAHIVSAEDRAMMRDIACNLGQASVALHFAFEDFSSLGAAKWPVFGPLLMAKLEDLACAVEDMSETAALGASEEFATAVRTEIQASVDEHHKQFQTA